MHRGGSPQRARVLSWRVGEGTRGVGTPRQQPRTTHSLFLIASHQCALGNVFGLMCYIRRDECLPRALLRPVYHIVQYGSHDILKGPQQQLTAKNILGTLLLILQQIGSKIPIC